jgi:hypothetical protein
MLPEYVADGHPREPDDAVLRAHLAVCPQCRAEAERLCRVEAALRSWPIAAAPPELAPYVLAAVAGRRRDAEPWQVLPWRIWVPAVAATLALLVSVLAMSVDTWPSADQVQALLAGWHASVADWLAPLQVRIDPNVFWAIWSGIFATTAGLGISLGLRAFNQLDRRELDHLEAQAGEVADRVWGRLRGAH